MSLTRRAALAGILPVLFGGANARAQGQVYTAPANASNGCALLIEDQRDVIIRDGEVDGNLSGQSAWREHVHGIILRNSHNVTIEGMTFYNLSGDGVYVTGGSSGVTIRGNTFLGSHENRNGVSVICGENILIEGNTFSRMARAEMPGAIDCEPNDPAEFIRDVTIRDNVILGAKKNSATAGILVFNAKGAGVNRITISHNRIRGGMTFGILLNHASGVSLAKNDIKGFDKRAVKRM